MVRAVPQLCLDFLRKAEALKNIAYQDGGGVWTIGVGHTGPEVRKGVVWTDAQIDAALAVDATKFAGVVCRAIADDASVLALTDHQYSALISLAFNVGTIGRTIPGLVRARNYGAVPGVVAQYDHERIKGKLVEVQGLINRRMAEIALWKQPDVAAAVAIAQAAPVAPPPSSYTRAADTPPAGAETKPPAQSKSVVSTACATVGATCMAAINSVPGLAQNAKAGVDQVVQVISPYADKAPALQTIIADASMVSAGLAVVSLVFVYLKHRRAQA